MRTYHTRIEGVLLFFLFANLVGCNKQDFIKSDSATNEEVSIISNRIAVGIKNQGFESGTLQWGTNFSIATTSPKPYAGTKNARLISATGSIDQPVTVLPQTIYVLSARVTGNGVIGAKNGATIIDSKTIKGIAGDTIWRLVVDTFSSGNFSSLFIFGNYGTDVVNFDDFKLAMLTPVNPSGLVLAANSTTSITLNWIDNSNDETGFKIERKIESGTWSDIATVSKNIRTFTNSGVAENTKYSYRVRAFITGGNFSQYSNIDSIATGRTVACSTAAQLTAAIANSKAGDNIILSNGTYSGRFATPLNRNGLPNNPITVIGNRGAILDGNDVNTGYGLYLNSVNYWIVKGITIRNCLKGVMLDSCNYCLLDSLLVTNTGEEGIHLRTYSRNNTVKRCEVNNTGKKTGRAGYGEGIYIGTAVNNWVNYTNGNPDNCDNNVVEFNTIGPNITAECIDVKEGTTGGIYRNNLFDSDGISGENGGDCWMDLKGNNNLVENNVGNNPTTETDFVEGYGVHVKASGWGNNNIFRGNSCTVNRPGYGIKVSNSSLGLPNPAGTIVCSTNTVVGAGSGLTNITITTNCQ